jgi:DNA-binding NarL/FixJ family response regulator
MVAVPSRSDVIRTVLAEDETLLRSVLPGLLRDASAGLIEVVDTCRSRSALLYALRRSRPDVVVCDVRMPSRDADQPTAMDERYLRGLFRQYPDTRVVLLTGQPDPLLARALIDAGASGYLQKSVEPQRICESIQKVSEGHRCIDPAVQSAIDLLEIRTDRQVREQLLEGRRGDVLRLLLDGQSAPEIAASLSVGRKYVDKRIAEIKRMTGADTPIRVYRACERLGIIRADRKH